MSIQKFSHGIAAPGISNINPSVQSDVIIFIVNFQRSCYSAQYDTTSNPFTIMSVCWAPCPVSLSQPLNPDLNSVNICKFQSFSPILQIKHQGELCEHCLTVNSHFPSVCWISHLLIFSPKAFIAPNVCKSQSQKPFILHITD